MFRRPKTNKISLAGFRIYKLATVIKTLTLFPYSACPVFIISIVQYHLQTKLHPVFLVIWFFMFSYIFAIKPTFHFSIKDFYKHCSQSISHSVSQQSVLIHNNLNFTKFLIGWNFHNLELDILYVLYDPTLFQSISFHSLLQ